MFCRILPVILSSLASFLTGAIAAEAREGNIRVLGRGVENEATGDILQLECLPESADCASVRAVLIPLSGEYRRFGEVMSPSAWMDMATFPQRVRASELAHSTSEKLVYKNALVLGRRGRDKLNRQIEKELERRTKVASQLSSRQWNVAQVLVGRDVRYWQLKPLRVSQEVFGEFVRAVSSDDSVLTDLTGCAFDQIGDHGGEETGLPFVNDEVRFYLRNLPYLKRWEKTRAPDAELLSVLFRKHYRYLPVVDGKERRFHIVFKRWTLSAWTHCITVEFRFPGSSQGFFKGEHCRRTEAFARNGENHYPWDELVKSFPSCEEIRRALGNDSPNELRR